MIIRVQGEAELQNNIYYEYDSESVPLGQGGMGIVYQGYCFNALDTSEYVPVAIKSIQNPTKDLVDRAMREASIQIDHPNLLRMYGFIPNMEMDEYSQTFKPRYYLVMERIVGVSLENLMKGVLIDKSGTFVDFAKELYDQYITDRVSFIKRISAAVGEGLGALHKAGYVHRDVDPSNIMVTHDGKIKLIDFGVTKTIQAYNGPKLTQMGAIIGKLDYAAPEIITGDITNHNQTTDIYAFGILIYQMFTGFLPFQGDNAQVMHAQVHTPVPSQHITDRVIKTVVDKATAKIQSERYQDVASLVNDIHRTGVEEETKKSRLQKSHSTKITAASGVFGLDTTERWIIAACAVAGLLVGVILFLLT